MTAKTVPNRHGGNMTPEEIEREKLLNEGYTGETETPETAVVDETPNLEEDQEQESVEQDVVEEQEEKPVDPWEGVSPILKEQFESLSQRLNSIDQLGQRLRSAEGRVGDIIGRLQKAEQVKVEPKEAPTKEQIKEAAVDEKKWSALKEEWPEWADMLEEREKVFKENLLHQIPDANAITQKVQAEVDARLKADAEKRAQDDMAAQIELVDLYQPEWRTKVNSGDFANWLNLQNDKTKRLYASQRAVDSIKLLNMFDARPTGKTAAQIKAEQQERLNRSVETKRSGKTTKTKSEADMTPEELRKHLLRKGYEED